MKTDTKKLIDDILNLPLQIRALLAEKILESLDIEDDFTISKEWKNEIERRCNEIDEGRAKLTNAEEVFAKAFRKVAVE